MDRIIRGVHNFREKVYLPQRDFYKKLAEKPQRPLALFITCADSRVDPNRITQTEPGDLFILRNAGHIIPPYSVGGGEAATIEYAVAVLGIRHIILCGHSDCGATQGLVRGIPNLPAVSNWFTHAEATRRLAQERYAHLEGAELLRAVTEENVLIQLNHLSTHPVVISQMAQGNLQLYAWYYEIEKGLVHQYDQACGQFLPLEAEARPALPLNLRDAAPCCTGRPATNGSATNGHAVELESV